MELRGVVFRHLAEEVTARPGEPERFAGLAMPALFFLAVAILTRCAVYGNPVVQIDEQFYLLVGDRMLQGYLPYIDMWDRKPLGLFLIYAAIRWLGGEGIYQYQAVATLFAAATAFILYRLASFVAPKAGAMAAGVVYLIYLLLFNGVGGQSPIFYNLLTSCAVLLSVGVLVRKDPGNSLVSGMGIMVLLGVAIQIKYTVVFEGMFIGIALLLKNWSEKKSPVALAISAAVWVSCALLPTGAALAYYGFSGQGGAFVHANFLSVFDRHENATSALKRLAETMLLLAPLLAVAAYGARLLIHNPGRAGQVSLFLLTWAVAAIAGYLVFGSYYDHYALPLLLPLAVVAAPTFGARAALARMLSVAAFATGSVAGAMTVHDNIEREGSREQLDALTREVHDHLHGQCMHIYEGPPVLYLKTNACFTTEYIFPSHLGRSKEAAAIGVRPDDELKHLLSRKPRIVLMHETPRKGVNAATRNLLIDAVSRDYHAVGRQPLGRYVVLIYVRNP